MTPNGLWQNHVMTRTHSFIGFFTASYYLTNYTITHLTSSRALMSHSTYSSVLLLTYFLGLILLKGAVYKCLVGRPRRYKKQRKEFLQLFSVPQGIAFEAMLCLNFERKVHPWFVGLDLHVWWFRLGRQQEEMTWIKTIPKVSHCKGKLLWMSKEGESESSSIDVEKKSCWHQLITISVSV